MNYKLNVFFIILLLAIPVLAKNQKKENILPAITITASRFPVSNTYNLRHTMSIDSTTLENNARTAITELLNMNAAVDIRHRGIEGNQGDIHIRGSNFEQTLVLIDGININSRQTGHHNGNIPISLDLIDRIEIMNGHGSNIYGSNAFGGVINIITKNTQNNNYLFAGKIRAGTHNDKQYQFSFHPAINKFNTIISFERKDNDGYRYNTEYQEKNCFIKSSGSISAYKINTVLSVLEKEFGANQFYTASFPGQWEKIRQLFSHITIIKKINATYVKTSLSYTSLKDYYVLDKNRPEWYNNIHTNYNYRASCILNTLRQKFDITLGSNYENSILKSSNLGNRNLIKIAVFVNLGYHINDKTIVELNGRYDNYSEFSSIFTPGINMLHLLNSNHKLRASFSKVFRMPSFTELYYVSPANQGNEQLQPEDACSYEIGYDYNYNQTQLSLTSYYRYGDNAIDWIKNKEEEPWQARNVGKIKTSGIDLSLSLRLLFNTGIITIKRVSVSYSYIYSSLNMLTNYSKYLQDYIRNKFVINSELRYNQLCNQSITCYYIARRRGDSYWLADTAFSKKITSRTIDASVFVKIKNIFNISYSEIGDIPMPDRLFSLGMNFSL